MFDDDDDRDYRGNGYAHGERRRGRKVCEYIYRHADGDPYLRVERFTVKPEGQEHDQFPQSHWKDGVWVSGPPPGSPIPYRLPLLLKAPLNEPVISCEGEKDADNLAALGFVTTCNAGGAGKWHPALNKWFEGRPQVILPEDNDEAGRDHVLKVASALRDTVPDIRTIDFRDMHKGADPSDWITRGRSSHHSRSSTSPHGITSPFPSSNGRSSTKFRASRLRCSRARAAWARVMKACTSVPR